MKKMLPLLILPLVLTACLERIEQRPPLKINALPRYGEGAPRIQNYGPWFVNGCTLTGGNTDFSISTQGQYEHGTLRMKLQSNQPLTRLPRVTINVLNAPIEVDGRAAGRSFGFNLPFAAHQVAKYTNENAYLFVHYQKLGSTEVLEGFLALNPLLSGLGALSRAGCK